MTARNFLIRGLLAGLIAGVCAFLVGYVVGEPHVDAAIAVEEATAAAEEDVAATVEAAAVAEESEAGHSHGEAEETVVSRDNQRTWGLATATIATGTALGGIVALVAASAIGRIGRLTPGQSTALISAVGFVSLSLVPFLKYPATPPAVGDPETIAGRTAAYFGYLLVSVVAATLAVALAQYLLRTRTAFQAVVIPTAGYLVVVVVAGYLMPTVNELGNFPADTLWYFRRASMITLATVWAVIGVVLTALVGKLYERETQGAPDRTVAAVS